MSALLMPQYKSAPIATPKVLTYVDAFTNTGDLTAYTFSSVGLTGDYAHVCVIGSNGTRTVSSLTAGGVTGTQNIQSQDSNRTLAIYTIDLASAANDDVVVTWSGSQARCAIGVFGATGISSTTAIDTDADTSGVDPATLTLTSESGGYIICCADDNGGNSAPNFTWSAPTERWDIATEGASLGFSGASDETPSTTFNVSVSCDTGTCENLIAATF